MSATAAAAAVSREVRQGTTAPAPVDLLTLALRGVLSRHRLRGVDEQGLQRLCRRHLPEPTARMEIAPADVDEFDDLLDMLLDHRCDDGEDTRWLACAIATACFGNNHLWQDMGLPNRAMLSELLRRHFAALYDKNAGDMKWKKFFYKQLCERMRVQVCKAPSCGVCVDYALCFGPEDGTPQPAVPPSA